MRNEKSQCKEVTGFTVAIWALSEYKSASLKEKKTDLFASFQPFK